MLDVRYVSARLCAAARIWHSSTHSACDFCYNCLTNCQRLAIVLLLEQPQLRLTLLPIALLHVSFSIMCGPALFLQRNIITIMIVYLRLSSFECKLAINFEDRKISKNAGFVRWRKVEFTVFGPLHNCRNSMLFKQLQPRPPSACRIHVEHTALMHK